MRLLAPPPPQQQQQQAPLRQSTSGSGQLLTPSVRAILPAA